MEVLSGIGAHLEFQKPEFVMPEQLLKDLWVQGSNLGQGPSRGNPIKYIYHSPMMY